MNVRLGVVFLGGECQVRCGFFLGGGHRFVLPFGVRDEGLLHWDTAATFLGPTHDPFPCYGHQKNYRSLFRVCCDSH